jgi:dihydrofolate synthase/folylpolyglutamate synthase
MSDAAALDRLMSLGGELHTSPGEPRRKFDLAHMRSLLGAVGNPQQRFRSVLIAGTNGKGSTAATLASVLAASGYRVGLYTSPHLTRINERIQINPAPGAGVLAELEDAALFEHLARVEAASAALVADGILPGPPASLKQ